MSRGNPTLKRFIKRALYSLKRRYGLPVDVYQSGSNTADVRTGVVDIGKTVHRLKKAIVLPSQLTKEEHRTISIISANKQMLQGGWYEADVRTILIERAELPGIELGTDDWFVFQGRKYAIISVQDYELNMGWIIRVRALTGETPQQIHVVKAESFIEFTGASSDDS